CILLVYIFFFFSSRRRHTRFKCDWSSDVCSSDLVARPEADVGEQESLLAERHEPGNNLAETKVESAWPGKVTGCSSVNATISICTEFLAGTAESWRANASERKNNWSNIESDSFFENRKAIRLYVVMNCLRV